MNTVGQALLINRPAIYDSNFPSALTSSMSNLKAAIAGSWITAATGTHFGVTTKAGIPFTVFAKNTAWDLELYANLVAPTLQSSIYVETWMHGTASNNIPKDCAGSKYKYSVLNVGQVDLTKTITWSETSDHSKWAVAVTSQKGNVCIGDINRQFSQELRGGGTVCFSNSEVWTSFNAFVDKSHSDSCVGYNGHRSIILPRDIPEI